MSHESPVIDERDVKRLLLTAFPDAQVELEDLTGTQDHYQAVVISAAFEGRTPVEQHRLVYEALSDAMRGPIHALALRTYTPSSWAKQGNN